MQTFEGTFNPQLQQENESEVLRMQREITAISEIWKKSVEWERAMENASLTTASPSLSHHMKKVLWQFRLILMPLHARCQHYEVGERMSINSGMYTPIIVPYQNAMSEKEVEGIGTQESTPGGEDDMVLPENLILAPSSSETANGLNSVGNDDERDDDQVNPSETANGPNSNSALTPTSIGTSPQPPAQRVVAPKKRKRSERTRGSEGGNKSRTSIGSTPASTPLQEPENSSNTPIIPNQRTPSPRVQEMVPVIRIPASSVPLAHTNANYSHIIKNESVDNGVAGKAPQYPEPSTQSFRVLPSSRAYKLPNFPAYQVERANSEPQTPSTTPRPEKSTAQAIVIDSPSPPPQGHTLPSPASSHKQTTERAHGDVRSSERPRRSATNAAKLSKAIMGTLMESDVEDEY